VYGGQLENLAFLFDHAFEAIDDAIVPAVKSTWFDHLILRLKSANLDAQNNPWLPIKHLRLGAAEVLRLSKEHTWVWISILTRSIGAAPVLEIAAETPPTMVVSKRFSSLPSPRTIHTQEVDGEVLSKILSQM
jgi:hypothetical protein